MFLAFRSFHFSSATASKLYCLGNPCGASRICTDAVKGTLTKVHSALKRKALLCPHRNVFPPGHGVLWVHILDHHLWAWKSRENFSCSVMSDSLWSHVQAVQFVEFSNNPGSKDCSSRLTDEVTWVERKRDLPWVWGKLFDLHQSDVSQTLPESTNGIPFHYA